MDFRNASGRDVQEGSQEQRFIKPETEIRHIFENAGRTGDFFGRGMPGTHGEPVMVVCTMVVSHGVSMVLP